MSRKESNVDGGLKLAIHPVTPILSILLSNEE